MVLIALMVIFFGLCMILLESYYIMKNEMMNDIFEFNEKNHIKIPDLFKKYSSSVSQE